MSMQIISEFDPQDANLAYLYTVVYIGSQRSKFSFITIVEQKSKLTLVDYIYSIENIEH